MPTLRPLTCLNSTSLFLALFWLLLHSNSSVAVQDTPIGTLPDNYRILNRTTQLQATVTLQYHNAEVPYFSWEITPDNQGDSPDAFTGSTSLNTIQTLATHSPTNSTGTALLSSADILMAFAALSWNAPSTSGQQSGSGNLHIPAISQDMTVIPQNNPHAIHFNMSTSTPTGEVELEASNSISLSREGLTISSIGITHTLSTSLNAALSFLINPHNEPKTRYMTVKIHHQGPGT